MKTIIHDYDYMDMSLGFAYRFLNNQSILTTEHAHNYYEYFLITSGAITHVVNRTRETLHVGDLVLIRPDDYHYYEPIEASDCTIINVSFSSHHFYDACHYLGDDTRAKLMSSIKPPQINIIPYTECTLIDDHDFLKFFTGSNSELYLRIRLLLLEVLATFLKYNHLAQPSSESGWLLHSLNQMTSQENIEEGVPALLRITGFSHGHLCRIMKQQLNITPSQYITKIRMVYVSNMLLNSDTDILTISIKAGYSSLSHFITIFKEHFGMTPSKYRQQHTSQTWK